jgi:hypothetical protein
MRRAACFLSIAGVALAPAAASAAAARDLSGFLGGFETECSGSKDFVRYMSSLGEKYTSSGDLSRPVFVPEAFRDSIGEEKVADKGEYVDISVPLQGIYRGLPVSRLDFWLGNENGIHAVAITFDAPVATVQSKLGAKVAGARKTLATKFPDGAPSIDILPEKGGARLLCDLSD